MAAALRLRPNHSSQASNAHARSPMRQRCLPARDPPTAAGLSTAIGVGVSASIGSDISVVRQCLNYAAISMLCRRCIMGVRHCWIWLREHDHVIGNSRRLLVLPSPLGLTLALAPPCKVMRWARLAQRQSRSSAETLEREARTPSRCGFEPWCKDGPARPEGRVPRRLPSRIGVRPTICVAAACPAARTPPALRWCHTSREHRGHEPARSRQERRATSPPMRLPSSFPIAGPMARRQRPGGGARSADSSAAVAVWRRERTRREP